MLNYKFSKKTTCENLNVIFLYKENDGCTNSSSCTGTTNSGCENGTCNNSSCFNN